jgi:hypothetical protein
MSDAAAPCTIAATAETDMTPVFEWWDEVEPTAYMCDGEPWGYFLIRYLPHLDRMPPDHLPLLAALLLRRGCVDQARFVAEYIAMLVVDPAPLTPEELLARMKAKGFRDRRPREAEHAEYVSHLAFLRERAQRVLRCQSLIEDDTPPYERMPVEDYDLLNDFIAGNDEPDHLDRIEGLCAVYPAPFLIGQKEP